MRVSSRPTASSTRPEPALEAKDAMQQAAVKLQASERGRKSRREQQELLEAAAQDDPRRQIVEKALRDLQG